MTTWEYRESRSFGEVEELGREGWELVSVVPSPGGEPTFYLKRPAPSFRECVTLDQKRHYYGVLGITAGEQEGSR